MNHNISQRKRRSEAMAAELGVFAEYELAVTCSICGQAKRHEVATYAGRFGKHTVAAITSRLRSSIPTCQGRPAALSLRRGGDEIPLIGPGACG